MLAQALLDLFAQYLPIGFLRLLLRLLLRFPTRQCHEILSFGTKFKRSTPIGRTTEQQQTSTTKTDHSHTNNETSPRRSSRGKIRRRVRSGPCRNTSRHAYAWEWCSRRSVPPARHSRRKADNERHPPRDCPSVKWRKTRAGRPRRSCNPRRPPHRAHGNARAGARHLSHSTSRRRRTRRTATISIRHGRAPPPSA